jgi:hypothetical protein
MRRSATGSAGNQILQGRKFGPVNFHRLNFEPISVPDSPGTTTRSRRCVISAEMVRKHRAAIYQPLVDTTQDRAVTRGGATYTMKTADIGHA